MDDLISSIRTGKAFGSAEGSTNRQRRKPSVRGKFNDEEKKDPLKEKFQNHNEGAVGRLRRQEPDKIPSFQNKAKGSSDLAKLLAKDGMKQAGPAKKIDKKDIPDMKANLKSTSVGFKETPSELRNKFEQASKTTPAELRNKFEQASKPK